MALFQSPRTSMKVKSKDSSENPSSIDENMALLQHKDTVSSLTNPTYDSVDQSGTNAIDSSEKEVEDICPPYQSKVDGGYRRARPLKKLSAAAALALTALMLLAIASFFPTTIVPNFKLLYSQLVVDEFVFAPDVANETTTFQQLAHSMVPSWYATTLCIMPIFTPTVLPGDVYKARKILLKTRDLFDVFSPVYPNTTSDDNVSSVDLWKETRHHLNVGYMIVGEFQDLHNAHIIYTQAQMEDLRKEVLDWKHAFDDFRASNPNVVDYVASPSPLSFRHHESHLFWGDATTLPSGTDSATSSLRIIGTMQLKRALQYLYSVFSYASVMDEYAHAHYHNLRKELRSIVDEYELFGSVMYPDTERVHSSMDVLTTARKLLGDINDDWTAYSFYVENDEQYGEQTRLARAIDEAWAYFQLWVHESKFEGAIQYLLDRLNPSPQPGESVYHTN